MKNYTISELTFENIGYWPLPVKIVTIAATCLLVLIFGYVLDIRNLTNEYERFGREEADLKSSFEFKQNQVANLSAYEKQMQIVEDEFRRVLQQLPEKSEVPALLQDISEMGLAAGLRFKLFKPMDEKQQDFYIELPIKIVVVGTYHQLGEFVSNIAGMRRIVTLNDFSVLREDDKGKDTSVAPTEEEMTNKEAMLVMDLTAKTYRYSEEKSGDKNVDAK